METRSSGARQEGGEARIKRREVGELTAVQVRLKNNWGENGLVAVKVGGSRQVVVILAEIKDPLGEDYE